jgi:lipopolysaccharide export system protein LptA
VRLTIERLRTLVLAAGVLLAIALAAFLVVGKWRSPLSGRDLPRRLGMEIQQEANGVTYTQNHAGHALFKIHASKVVELKNSHAQLHDVKIELYGVDGSRVDRIEGDEFEYDQQAGTARAAGPVEITLMRPGVTPAIATRAAPAKSAKEKAAEDKSKNGPLTGSAASTGEIHVKTSGLEFNQNSGVATTGERVDFSLTGGSGSAVGATYDSQQGRLILNRQVELSERRGAGTVQVHAQHAEFERGDLVCHLIAATASYPGEEASAGDATVLFREDGTAVRLDVTGGFTLATASGGHLAAPEGWLEFNEHNRPRRGRLNGGVAMDSESGSGNSTRQVHGTSPAAALEFTPEGELERAHLQRGVEFTATGQSDSASGPARLSRKWRSPVADVLFRDAGRGHVEPASIHGTGGVILTGESRRGAGPVLPSRLSADDLTGVFGPGSALTAITGVGHAEIEETNPAGTRLTSSGDRLDAQFAARPAPVPGSTGKAQTAGGAQIDSAELDGNVVMVEQPAPRPGASAPAPMRATAGRAGYDGAGEWLHLTINPRLDDGGLQMSADKIDLSRASGDAFAHGDVKATWVGSETDNPGRQGTPASAANPGAVALGGRDPAHVIAAEAQFHQTTGVATFRGQARLWQQANSVSAPVIVLDRERQTLVARSTDPADPVRVVMVSVAGSKAEKGSGADSDRRSAAPAVIRVRAADLKYSDAEHKALMRGGNGTSVVAETGAATTTSDQLELILLPPGNHAGKDGGAAQVDRMTASGRVTVASQARRGTGEQLVYSGETGEYVLTGTADAPPRMTDPDRGSVTGEALIFHSRDDSVSIEGGGHRTITETRTPK